jgi:hypothetical protein
MEYYYCKVCNKNIGINKGDILRCTQCGYFLLTPKLPMNKILKIKIAQTSFCTFCKKMVFSIPINIMIEAITQRTKWEIKTLRSNGITKNGRTISETERNKIANTILNKFKSALEYLFHIKHNFDFVCSFCRNGVKLNLKPPLKIQAVMCSFCDKEIDLDSTFCKFCGAKIEENTRYIPKEIKNEVWERDKGRCAKCGSILDLEFDHIIPFSKGGANSVGNLQILCSRCNKKKANKING